MGVVDELRYATIRQAIIDDLRSLVDPASGQNVFDNVQAREDIYHGDETYKAGDIILQPNYRDFVQIRPSYLAKGLEFISTLSSDELREMFTPPGIHRPNGMLIVNGPGVPIFSELVSTFGQVNIEQMAQPILKIFGITNWTITQDSGVTTKFNQELTLDSSIVDRLRGLGYIE